MVLKFVKKYWPALLVLVIFISGLWLRVAPFDYPYLRNIDSYIMWRHMDYVIHYGHILSPDPLMLAPVGMHQGFSLYPYLGAYSYMLVAFFTGLQLWEYLIYFPAFLASLMAIPMYYIGKYLWDKRAGVLAAFFVVFNVSVVGRSLGGDPDTDSIVMLMPLITTAVFLFVYKNIDKRALDRNLLAYALFGFVAAVFALIWSGYWYIFLILYGFLLLKIILRFAYKRSFESVKPLVIMFILSLVVFWVVVLPFSGLKMIYDPVEQPLKQLGVIGPGLKGEEGIRFPNVYVSVQELQVGGGLKQIAERTSGISFSNPLMILISPLVLTLFAFLYMLYAFFKYRRRFDTLLLMLLWFIGPLIAAMVAVRFATLLTPVFSIGAAIFFVIVLDWFRSAGENNEDKG